MCNSIFDKNFNYTEINLFNDKYYHLDCSNNINFLLHIISHNNKLTEKFFNKIKNNTNHDNVSLYSNCFLCNKKSFRLNLDKYTFDSYTLYLSKIKICKIQKNNMVYNHYNINDKTYAHLCYICKDKITNHNFYNNFLFDNLEKDNNILSEKQIDILNKIKIYCTQ